MNMLEHKYKDRSRELFKTITAGNGPEFLNEARMDASILASGEKRTTIYYAHPYIAYERGSNEDANCLIRRFIPNGRDIDKLTKAQIKRIERWINHYPMRIFGYRSATR